MSNPMQMWSNWLELSARAVRLGWDAQNVIALRLMRLATSGTQGHSEVERMVAEKFAALAEAQAAGAAAVLTGRNGHRVTKKVLGVYEKRVRGNRRRLSR